MVLIDSVFTCAVKNSGRQCIRNKMKYKQTVRLISKHANSAMKTRV